MESILQAVDQVRRSIRQVWWGRSEVVDLLLIALLAGGHVLAEDVPGVGKTTLLKSLVRSLGLGFRRIQCTPDLLPADVVGTTYFEQRSGEWRFRPGPILSQVVLADEINRATPRTQSALLEAMEERQVTVDGETHPCPRPFLLLATQNPVELEGTFPLPEAQVDRFLLRLRPGYPSAADEQAMVARHAAGSRWPNCNPCSPWRRCWSCSGRWPLSGSLPRCSHTWSPWYGRPGRMRRCGSAPAHERRWRCTGPVRRWPSCAAAITSFRTT